ncbi:MAG: hypothetical protein KJP22_14840 [Acidimicrobiia bacterium]|nr:hypothetical protein [Acidimicrobiia bacterium]MBT8194679.1 hypothetical protein [Acidimicrobiia bacterium]NNF89008.1 hypothetical protein [Acidimicrobiia bacterium]NNJ46551.1 hypothetical protein [Acidimicrobiia bacterium]NNL12091.1 hypothetical protein [Acidimicrobiia bacterium]
MTEHRRRIDQIIEPDFVVGLEELSLDDLRDRRRMCDDVENELSYYRRMLHGRMDLLGFELRRRSGEETRSLIEALPEILTDGASGYVPSGRPTKVTLPDLPDQRRRHIDEVLEADFLTRIALVEDDELNEIQRSLVETETEISTKRHAVQEAFNTIQAELTRRYKDGLANFDEILGRSD